MKTISWLLLISMINFISCSSTYLVNNYKAYDELNRNLAGKRAWIKFKNDDSIITKDVNVGVDSTYWNELKLVRNRGVIKKTERIVPTSEIKKEIF